MHTGTAEAAIAAKRQANQRLRRPDQWRVFLGVALVAAAIRVVVPATPFGLTPGIGGLALAAVLLEAAVRHGRAGRDGRSWGAEPWVLIGIGMAPLVAGELLRSLSHHLGSFPSWLDWIEFSGCPFTVAGLLRLVSHEVRERSVDSLFLATIGPLVLGFAGWLFLAEQAARASMGPTAAALAVLFVSGYGVALALAGRAALLARGDGVSPRYLVAGFSCLLGAELSRTAGSLAGAGHDPLGARALLILAFGLWGAAALHPSATSSPEVPRIAKVGAARVTLLAGTVVLGPALVVHEALSHRAWVVPAAMASGLFSLLVVVHLLRVARERSVLEHYALHDELTGLPRRRLFNERVNLALERAAAEQRRLALFFIDLDHFKTINDSLGHALGNELLQAAAVRLAERAPDALGVARFGGDEFCVLAEIGCDEDVDVIAEALVAALSNPFAVGEHRLFVTPSIGAAVFPEHGRDADELLRNADTAMYRAKERGRATYHRYDPQMTSGIHRRLALANHLHTAIERDELVLHYQPKVNLRSGAIVGMEALVRWHHPDFGVIPPGLFIDIAEETGLIVALGDWVLEAACRQTQAWMEEGLPKLTVAVNLSARQFFQEPVADKVAAVLRRTGLPPDHLELELTESLAVDATGRAAAELTDLKAIGVQCSIDDFGTGYSSLSYLTRFPIDRLKIDKSFVERIHADRGDAAIVLAVIAMAHSLGLEVVAEGVETEEQLSFLRDQGCDVMQGYLFSRPLPAGEFRQLVVGEGRSPSAARTTAPAFVSQEALALMVARQATTVPVPSPATRPAPRAGGGRGRRGGRRGRRAKVALAAVAMAAPAVLGFGAAEAATGGLPASVAAALRAMDLPTGGSAGRRPETGPSTRAQTPPARTPPPAPSGRGPAGSLPPSPGDGGRHAEGAAARPAQATPGRPASAASPHSAAAPPGAQARSGGLTPATIAKALGQATRTLPAPLGTGSLRPSK